MNDPLLRCHDDFESGTGKTCNDYKLNNWCTTDGEYGSAWTAGQKFEYFKNENGIDASSCTVCGCKELLPNNLIPNTDDEDMIEHSG